jgi:hypothetical protein
MIINTHVGFIQTNRILFMNIDVVDPIIPKQGSIVFVSKKS